MVYKYQMSSVELTETSEEPISHELTNPPEAIHEEVVETTEQFEPEQLNSESASPRSSSPSAKSGSSSPPSDSSSIHDEEIKDGNVVNSDEH